MNALSIKEKLGYGFGDLACGFIWQATMILLAFFYTDVFGIPASVMGTLFLTSRILDAITDPLMGIWVDRTRTKYGQFRPFLLWGAIPFALASIATFYTPDFSETGKIIYACITYIGLTLAYTFVNVPYCAMAGAITNDPDERHKLQSVRFFCALGGGLIISGIALPLVNLIGDGNLQKGYFGAMCILGTVGGLLLFICFKNTNERISFPKKENENFFGDFKYLFQNSQWKIMCVFKCLATCSTTVRGAVLLYFVKYIMERPDLSTEFLLTGSIAAMFGCLLSERILHKFDRITSFKINLIIFSIISIALYFAPDEYLLVLFALNILFLFTFNVTTVVQWLMASDVIDYEEHRSGRRLDGLVFASYLFSLKIGLAIGGAFVGWVLGYVNYNATLTAQPEETIQAIKFLFCIAPVILFIGMYILLLFYKLDSKTIKAISEELAKKRASLATK
ncbi:MFS transporter [[Pasteurella] aerogenes]|nr:MFS transporter [[Pasteurella] aerogenes]